MKTIKRETFGKVEVRLVETPSGFAGIVVRNGKVSEPIIGDDAEEVWSETVRTIGQSSVNYFGFEGARLRFTKLFAEGFESPAYRSMERDYKVDASAFLKASLPLAEATAATPEGCAIAAKAFSKTNLLSAYESARIHEVLKSGDGPAFLRGAALLAQDKVAEGLATMAAALQPYGQISWPVATYLPYMWRPEAHVFLKPQVTRDYADRVGHKFAHEYSPKFDVRVYESLIDLVAETERHIANLLPVDRIDVQSFIWVVGKYEDASVGDQAALNV